MRKIIGIITVIILSSGFAPHPLSEMQRRYNYQEQDYFIKPEVTREDEIKELILEYDCEWLGIQEDENDEPFWAMFNDMKTDSTLMVEMHDSDKVIIKHIITSRIKFGVESKLNSMNLTRRSV